MKRPRKKANTVKEPKRKPMLEKLVAKVSPQNIHVRSIGASPEERKFGSPHVGELAES